MAQAEVKELAERLEQIEQDLKIMLLPRDPNDEKNVVLEIRAGTGGDEATLFAAELYRMYTRYAEGQRWAVKLTDVSASGVGGLALASLAFCPLWAWAAIEASRPRPRVCRFGRRARVCL